MLCMHHCIRLFFSTPINSLHIILTVLFLITSCQIRIHATDLDDIFAHNQHGRLDGIWIDLLFISFGSCRVVDLACMFESDPEIPFSRCAMKDAFKLCSILDSNLNRTALDRIISLVPHHASGLFMHPIFRTLPSNWQAKIAYDHASYVLFQHLPMIQSSLVVLVVVLLLLTTLYWRVHGCHLYFLHGCCWATFCYSRD